MSKVNLERINLKKAELGEKPLKLKRITYKKPKIKNGYLVNSKGERIGTKGDMYAKVIMDDILQRGTLDLNPRPHYEDMQPAHTLSLNHGQTTPGILTYDLSKGESPLQTLRPIAVKSAIAELLWIYQKQSNDLVEFDELLGKNTWNENHEINNWWKDWAIMKDGKYDLNEKGHPHIGCVYGETVRSHNLINELLDDLKNNPDGRRHIINMWQVEDFKKPHGLKPCAYCTTWNIRHEWDGKDYLDMSLKQRSSDFATAGCINQVQYIILQNLIARHLGIEVGVFTWQYDNIQLYDRHIDQAIEMLNREPITCNPRIEINKDKTNFFDMLPEDIKIVDYPRDEIKEKNPQLKFPLGI